MAQGRRVERVAAAIRREVSELLHSGLRDERVQQGLVSVTGVEVAGDLQHCRIFVSVFGSDDDHTQAMEGLRAATPYVKGELGRRLRLRRTPEVVFQLDRGLERGMTVLGVLHRLEEERLARGEEGGTQEADTSGTPGGSDGAGSDPAPGALSPADDGA